MPASLQAQVTSVESRSNLIVDSHVQNEGNGWAGSGANPWHLDANTESILFLTNESAQPARMGFTITANDVHYYLTELTLKPHETRAIDLRKLRDAQLPDFRDHKIPATATDGSAIWQRIDNVPVMGRLMVINRQQGMASNYDCCICACPADYYGSSDEIAPGTSVLPVGGGVGLIYNAGMYSCNLGDYYVAVTDEAIWNSAHPGIATVNASARVTGVSGGTTAINGQYCAVYYSWQCLHPPYDFGCVSYAACGYPSNATSVVSVSQSPSSFNMSTGDTKQVSVTVTPSNVAVTLSFSGTSTPTSNPNSSGPCTLNISGSGSGTISSNVTASPAGNSGVYSVKASASGVTSSNSTTIHIPPQILIQMMYAEANGQNDSCREGLGLAFRNRMGDCTYFSCVTTYQNAIPGQASYNTSITTGVQNYLDDSVAVWSSSLADYTGGSGCFWSPTLTQWQTVQSALNSGTTTFPANVGDPGCYKTVSGYGPQIVYLSSVGTSTRGGQYAGAPAFVFERKRATTGSVPAAVVQLN